MPDGLTVTADGTDFVGAHLLLEQQFAHALCCKGDPALLDFGGAGDFIGTGAHRARMSSRSPAGMGR